MQRRIMITALATLSATIGATISATSHADLSYVQRIDVEAAGAMSMFSSTGTVLTQVSGDRARSDTELEMESRFASLLDQDSSGIIRLDKGVVWTLNPAKETYTEQSFADIRAELEEYEESMREAKGSGQLPVSEDSCKWTDPELEVESDRKRERIANIKTNKHTIRLSRSCTDAASGQTCDMTWVLETWLAKKIPARDEIETFQQAYAEALGLDELLQQAQGPGQALLTMFGDNWEEISEELDELDGYPVKSVMQMGIGGEQCLTADGDPIALDEIWADAGTAAYNAALGQVGAEAGRAVGQSAGRALGDSIGGSIGGAAVGAAAGEVIGGLTGMFKKKKKKAPAPEPEPQRSAADGQVTAFRITTEVTEWNRDDVPDERFEEPVGWKKK
jgi:PAS domain-containing protein